MNRWYAFGMVTVLYFLTPHSIAQRRQQDKWDFPELGTVKGETIDSQGNVK